jgi:sugar/nucleoside kinase (ribokinase family)
MARSEARGVGPSLFDRDWSRVSGSWQGLAKNAQMVRAARGYSPAIFKPISKGGCHTGAQLKAQLIYLSGITLWLYDAFGLDRMFALLTEARATGARVAFDGNYRPRLWGTDPAQARATYARMLALTDICLATHDDEASLWGDPDPKASHVRLAAAGIREVVVKCGAAGAWVAPDTLVAAEPDPSPVDTTAAGDNFNAGYLAARMIGQTPAKAAGAGNRLAGRVIAHRGALIPRAAMPKPVRSRRARSSSSAGRRRQR